MIYLSIANLCEDLVAKKVTLDEVAYCIEETGLQSEGEWNTHIDYYLGKRRTREVTRELVDYVLSTLVMDRKFIQVGQAGLRLGAGTNRTFEMGELMEYLPLQGIDFHSLIKPNIPMQDGLMNRAERGHSALATTFSARF